MDKYEELKEFLNSSKDIETVRNIAIELLDGNIWQNVYDTYETEIRKNFN